MLEITRVQMCAFYWLQQRYFVKQHEFICMTITHQMEQFGGREH